MLDSAERKMLYGFLSVLFRPPDEETLAIMEGVGETTFESVFPGLSAPPVPTLSELKFAHRHLFSDRPGGAPAPLCGSAYLDRPQSPGASTKLVASLYAGTGLDAGKSPEPPDYLPTELEFLFYLTEGEQQARAEETGTPPHRWVASQADFFHNFFFPWIGPFCDRIAADEKAHPFYLWAAELLRRFAEMEKGRLKAA